MNEERVNELNKKIKRNKDHIKVLETQKKEIRRQERLEEMKRENQKRESFKRKLEEDNGLSNRLSENILKDIFEYAWDEGHSSGYNVVALEYSALVSRIIDPMLEDFRGYLKKLKDT